MRIALLSTMESLADAGGDPCAFLPVAGRPIVQHQLECALALGCEKIACQAIGLPRELLNIQHLAEKAGAQFQIISGARVLSGLVSAVDELLVFADGLLPDQAAAAEALAGRPGVLVFPADQGVAAGYERIDRDYAWAGLFMVRGSAVEKLTQLSPDADPVAGLLRIALQTGTRMASMPADILANREWGLVRSELDAVTFETVWLGRHARSASFAAPSLAAADRAATAIMSRWGGRQPGSVAFLLGGAGLGLIGGLTAWFWQPFAGMGVLAAAYLTGRIGATLGSIEGAGRTVPKRLGGLAAWLGAMLDIALIVLAGLASAASDKITAVLATICLLIALRLGVAVGEVLPLRKWRILMADRTLLAIGLSVAIYFGQLVTVLQVLTIIALLAIIVDLARSKLTWT